MSQLQELQRHVSLFTLNLPHTAKEDLTIGGHRIKKGTAVIPQISAVLANEEFFTEPKKFNPARFLNDEGEAASLRHVDQQVPFSVGKRNCLGEGLARMELFMIFANFLRRFTVEKAPFHPFPTMETKSNSTIEPTEYNCRIRKRE